MDKRLNKVAAAANVAAYDEDGSRDYLDGAPHIKHRELRELYGQLVLEVYDRALPSAQVPRVLDLGADEGSVTLPFLELGAHVVAVDISQSQLDALALRCKKFGSRLELKCADIGEVLGMDGPAFDIIVVNSFLHHVPDYLDLIKSVSGRLSPHGQFFSFQDPLRYDSLQPFAKAFGSAAYLMWRVTKGDVIGGLGRKWRRLRGIYLDDSMHDNAEYHVTRNGVDQDAIAKLLISLGFDCRVIPYFSTQSGLFQPVGTALGLKNHFSIIAQRAKPPRT